MAYTLKPATTCGLAKFQPARRICCSPDMTRLSPGLTVSKAMRAGRSSKASLRCRAELGSQHQPSLHSDLSQGLRLDMTAAKTKVTALQNSALHVARQQNAATISELRDAVEELTETAGKQAAIIAAQTASTDCQSSVNKSRVQGLRLSGDMLNSKLAATALQNETLVTGRQQDAVRMQYLVDADTQLRATIAQQAATVADQAEAINRQKRAMAHNDRRLSITSKLLNKRWGRRKVEAIDLDYLASDSHAELLKSEKQGLQQTLEETEDELAKERQRTERAWAQAQRRAMKRQEAQVHTQVCLSLVIPACSSLQ
ncbi:TPA: hypothetical protein ACH3X3_011822 [Trebouxia sp. C0006]